MKLRHQVKLKLNKIRLDIFDSSSESDSESSDEESLNCASKVGASSSGSSEEGVQMFRKLGNIGTV